MALVGKGQCPPSEPPPPFSESGEYPASEQLPPYETPRYNDSTNGSTRLTAATRKFPPKMKGYFSWKSARMFYLGPSANEKLFAVSMHCGGFSGKPPLILYDGPTDKHQILASSKTEKHIMSRHLQINIPPRAENPAGTSIPFNSSERTFSVNVRGPGKEPLIQEFEWRKSVGGEIRELAGNSYGWKLVRTVGPSVAASGSRKERNLGYTSDGKEILAIVAYSVSASMSKAIKFAFMGEGLTGVNGEEWEIATVISAMWLWFLDTQVLVAVSPS